MKDTLNNPRRIRFDNELEAAIEELDTDFSKAVRRLCRQALANSQAQDLDGKFEQLETLRKQIGPIGSNLNQIAFGFNTDGHLYGEDLAAVHFELQKSFGEMIDVLSELRNGILRQII